ncbi:MAG: TPM domain-containing protein, partial [Stenotrophobium sp.]
ILIVPTTQPETIDQYSIRVVEAWKLGRKKVDDGALLLIAKNDHQMRIEVGYGLEGALPDAIANRIINEIIAPHFKQGDFFGGIDAGIDQMMSVVQGEPLPPPQRLAAQQHGDGNSLIGKLLVPFFILFALGHLLRRAFGTGPASALVGAGTGLAAFFILGSIALAVGAGVFAIVAAVALYSGAAGGLPMIGGFGGGGFGGGGFGGGGGGFSGGGGGFGGGGASGGW